MEARDETLHLCDDARPQATISDQRGRTYAAMATQQVSPIARCVVSDGGDHSHSTDYNATRAAHCALRVRVLTAFSTSPTVRKSNSELSRDNGISISNFSSR